MAQTSSAAREPSMEEILASIRRIIEDSDVVRQSVPPKPERPQVAPVRGEIAEFRRDPEPVLRPVEPAKGSVGADKAQEERQARQAEDAMQALAARIGLRGSLDPARSSGDIPVSGRDAAPQPKGDAVAMPAGVQPHFEAAHADNDASDDADDDYEPVLDASNDDREVAAVVSGRAHGAAADDAAPAHAEAPQNPAATGTAQEDAPRPAVSTAGSIISPATGRQVAAAFEDLSAAMRAEQRRSFDEMAEEMLRPMLQEWLDNNLPGLVERLVREEIERVVRAGRG
ncbi:PopZ family protein [Phyllobacterium phragmitis]